MRPLAPVLILSLSGLGAAPASQVPRVAPGLAPCAPPGRDEPVLLVVTSAAPELLRHGPAVQAALRRAAGRRLSLLPEVATERALYAEGGQEERERAVLDARVIIGRAEDRFRELDAEDALALLAQATAKLSSVHHEPGAIELLARTHLIAGAIYLARGRAEAARQRLQRALDLDPNLSPPRDRFAPEVLAEVAAVRASKSSRAIGRLEVNASGVTGADVFIDGRLAGTTPLVLNTVGAGNHLLRVSAPGHQSSITTIQIVPTEDSIVTVSLARDPEIEQLAELPKRLRAREDMRALFELLARRGGADRVLVASITLAGELTTAGTATIGLDLALFGAGVAYAPSLEPAALERALSSALACEERRSDAPHTAPAILGTALAKPTRLQPVPPPDPLWLRPWFWALAAVATIGVSGALVFARTSGGPPEAIEITLISRP